MATHPGFALAFAARYDDALRLLDGDTGPPAAWVRAWIASARGEPDAVAVALAAAEQAAGDDLHAARSLITAASALRQRGDHAAARPLDESALRRAPDEITRSHALLGLAADAIGHADAPLAARHLAEATATAAAAAAFTAAKDKATATADESTRLRIRGRWVGCELALLESRPHDAVAAAAEALALARAAGAPRHEAKSLLFLGIAERETGAATWREHLAEALALAGAIGAALIAAVASDELARVRPVG